MIRLERHFQDFVRERTYIENVSPRTLAWYRMAFQAFQRSRAGVFPGDTNP